MKLHKIGPNETEVELVVGSARYEILFSYNTPVAARWWKDGHFYQAKTEKRWSTTTSRHIGKWFGGCAKGVRTSPQAVFDEMLEHVGGRI